MKLDLDSFRRALFPKSYSQWAHETNGIFYFGISLLRDFDMANMTREQELEFYAIAIGAVIAGLAYNKMKYGDTRYTQISTEQGNEYYQVPHYPYAWGQLYKECKIDDILKTCSKPYRENVIVKENPVFLNMVKVTGTKVLKGELPFDKQQMLAIFPQLNAFFNKIESERNMEYQQIEALFDQVLSYKNTVYKNVRKDDFLAAVAQLKVHTLQQFKAGHPRFTFDKCLSLAQQTKELADNVMQNTIGQALLEQFKRNHSALDSRSTAERVLSTLVAVIVGIAVAIGGFVVAGPVGAAAAGVSAGAATLGLFALKKGPVATVEHAAKRVIADSDALDNHIFDEDDAAQYEYPSAPTYGYN